MIKDIVANLTVGAPRNVVADFAVSVAREFGAHLSGIAFAYEVIVPGTVFDGAAAGLIAAQREESEKMAKAAVDSFDAAVRGAGISAESRVMDASLVGAAELFSRIARKYDLAIVGQAEPDRMALENVLVEAALFESGRPILIVPYIQKSGLKLDRIMVCWDGSRNAARATGDAMPFLTRAKAVDVVIVEVRRVRIDELPGADIAHHLARHGLNVEVKRIVAPDIDVASAILSHAADSSADLIVMGGYGHSRLREFVLGGATRGILEAMTVPTLMSH
jgi:nucleotide-binding universal stress UspA family protein